MKNNLRFQVNSGNMNRNTSPNMNTDNQYVKYSITINQNSQSIVNNTSNVTVNVRFFRTNTGHSTFGTGTVWCRIDGTVYSASVTSSQKITSDGINLFTQTQDIGHNSDGSKTLTCSAWINLNTPLTSNEQSYSQSLTTIPRSSTFTGGSGNIGSTTLISISRASQNFTHILYYNTGSGKFQIASNIDTSYLWMIPTSFYSLIPNTNIGTGTLYLETYNGSTLIGTTSKNFNFYVTNSNPIFDSTSLSYQDTNQSITEVTGNNQWIVRNKSNLVVSWNLATSQNSATLTGYQINFNGVNYNLDTNENSYNFGTINSSNNLNLSIKAIDSRGNFTTISKTIIFLDWVSPSLITNLSRVNNFENDTNLTINSTISSVNNTNSIKTLHYQYKKTSDTNYSDWFDIQDNTEMTISLDNKSAWDFQFESIDAFGGSGIYTSILAKGMPILFFDTQKISIGVNQFPQNENSFETANLYINGKSIFDLIYPIGSIFMSANYFKPDTIFVGTTWVQWGQGRTIVGVDSNDASFDTPEETGGSKTIYLTVDQLPPHNHGIPRGPAGPNYLETIPYGQNNTPASTYPTNNAGNGESINIMQPYITCYLWKRTA